VRIGSGGSVGDLPDTFDELGAGLARVARRFLGPVNHGVKPFEVTIQK
jgi:hypothetical protein